MRRVVASLVLALALAPSGRALDIVNYSNTLHDRFTPGTFPSSPTENASFWQGAYDFSGVGWASNNSLRNVAMISPLHFVAANHFTPGGSLRFVNEAGVEKTYAISNGGFTQLTGLNSQRSDLVIGRLAAPIPAEDLIKSYAILELPTLDHYVDLPLDVYGWYSRVGTNTIDAFYQADMYDSSGNVDGDGDGTNDNLVFAFDKDSAMGEALAVSGDSGSPSFVPWNGSLSLVGIHSLSDLSTTSYDTFVPFFIDDLQSLLAADGYSLLLVPEAGHSLALLLAGAGLVLWLRRRRLRR